MVVGLWRGVGALVIGMALLAGPGPAGAGVATRPPEPAAAATAAASGMIEGLRPRPRRMVAAPPPAAGERRCTADGAHCISLASYVADVCHTIQAVARTKGLDPHFFARLIWRESLFDAGAVSPKGAQGIAQFMPGTAALRGLEDAFNPAEALAASGAYLAELTRSLGNIGLAAIAYNGGEARAARFIAGKGGLPEETRAYVQAITGHAAETWRDAPPAAVDLSLAPDQPFTAACIAQAAGRGLREFPSGPPVLPWGVVIASNRDRAAAERHAERLLNRHAAILRGERVAYSRERRGAIPRPLYYAQIGRQSREEAEALCERLRAAGGDCMVLRN